MRTRANGLGVRIRQIVRRMASQRRHSLGVALILGIGIGLAAMGLTAVDRVLLRPLPYAEPDRIGVVRISVRDPVNHAGLANDEILGLRSTSGTFKSVEWIVPPVVDLWGPTRATRSSRRSGFLWGWNRSSTVWRSEMCGV